jgi:hypothetical protein
MPQTKVVVWPWKGERIIKPLEVAGRVGQAEGTEQKERSTYRAAWHSTINLKAKICLQVNGEGGEGREGLEESVGKKGSCKRKETWAMLKM